MSFYKKKYLNIKKLLGGEETRYEHRGFIKDFCDNTNPDYKNCDERVLNVITIQDKDEFDFLAGISTILYPKNNKYRKSSVIIEKFISLIRHSEFKSIRHLEGFYNKKIRYDNKLKDNTCTGECGLEHGTIVDSAERGNIIFKTKTRIPFNASKGSGKKNLNIVAKKLRNDDGCKYLFLFSSGCEALVNVYKSYGFEVILDGDFFKNVFQDEYRKVEPEWDKEFHCMGFPAYMVGDIDIIIEKTT